MNMQKITGGILGAMFLIAPFNIAQALSSEVHITKDGATTISSAKIMQIAGGTLFARLYWGDAFVRFTIKTDSKTTISRATGETTTLAEVSEGDIVDATGTLEPGSNTLNLIASSIKNTSVQKGQAVISGSVTAINLSNREFTLNDKSKGVVTVKVGVDTKFNKGNRVLTIGSLRVGDTITKALGDYDYATKTLLVTGTPVTVYINMAQFTPQNFAGTLVEVVGATTTTPILKIKIGTTVHTVKLNEKTTTLNAARKALGINRFIPGDAVRFYGKLQEVDEPIIDNVEVIRNTSL